MSEYVCFNCGKTLTNEHIKKRVRCPYCGAKIMFKKRSISTIVDAV